MLDTAPQRMTRESGEDLREIHQQVMRTGQAAVSGLSDRQPPGSRAIAVALPIVQGGTVRYVLGARMGEAVWQRLATTASTPEGGHASIYRRASSA